MSSAAPSAVVALFDPSEGADASSAGIAGVLATTQKGLASLDSDRGTLQDNNRKSAAAIVTTAYSHDRLIRAQSAYAANDVAAKAA